MTSDPKTGKLAGLAKEELGKKWEDISKTPESGLAEGVKDGLLKKVSPVESGGERTIQAPGDHPAAGRPVDVSPGPFQQRCGR